MPFAHAQRVRTLVSTAVFSYIMIKDNSNFLKIGPNDVNELFGVKMNTWFKWWVTAIYTFVSPAIADFASDSLCPFFSNVVEDHKTRLSTFHTKLMCLMIVKSFTIYGVTMSVIGMFVALTQVVFMFIHVAADLVVNAHTTPKNFGSRSSILFNITLTTVSPKEI